MRWGDEDVRKCLLSLLVCTERRYSNRSRLQSFEGRLFVSVSTHLDAARMAASSSLSLVFFLTSLMKLTSASLSSSPLRKYVLLLSIPSAARREREREAAIRLRRGGGTGRQCHRQRRRSDANMRGPHWLTRRKPISPEEKTFSYW